MQSEVRMTLIYDSLLTSTSLKYTQAFKAVAGLNPSSTKEGEMRGIRGSGVQPETQSAPQVTVQLPKPYLE